VSQRTTLQPPREQRYELRLQRHSDAPTAERMAMTTRAAFAEGSATEATMNRLASSVTTAERRDISGASVL
jgi:hypothetical protein